MTKQGIGLGDLDGEQPARTHTIACKPELWRRLQAHAKTLDDRTTNYCAVQAIERYLDGQGEGSKPPAPAKADVKLDECPRYGVTL